MFCLFFLAGGRDRNENYKLSRPTLGLALFCPAYAKIISQYYSAKTLKCAKTFIFYLPRGKLTTRFIWPSHIFIALRQVGNPYCQALQILHLKKVHPFQPCQCQMSGEWLYMERRPYFSSPKTLHCHYTFSRVHFTN